MNLRIRMGTVGYNNKILISEGFSLGKNDGVNVGAHKDREEHPHTAFQINPQAHIDPHPHIDLSPQPHPHIDLSPHTAPSEVTHEEEKIALILSLIVRFTLWHMLRVK